MNHIHRTRNWTIGLLTAFAFLALGTISATVARADDVTDANVADRIAAAKTAQDHDAIAAFFRKEAAATGEKIKTHEAMIASWSKSIGGKSLEYMRRHCQDIITSLKKEQKDYEGLAAEHEKLAKEAGGK
jgi:hypothetical protein